MEDFNAQQIQIGAAKHLALEEFETIHMSLCHAITPGQGTSCVHGGIIPVDAIGKAGEFGDMTGFGTLEPVVEGFGLALFEQRHKILTDVIGDEEVR